jgi:hypothetical protein
VALKQQNGGRIMVRRTSLVLMVLVLFSLVCLCAADIAGKWKSEFESQVGAQKYTFEFKVVAGKITGSTVADIAGAESKGKITDGKIEGDKISFSESLDYNGSPLPIEYKGTISGDEIKVAREVQGQSDGTITLKRAK